MYAMNVIYKYEHMYASILLNINMENEHFNKITRKHKIRLLARQEIKTTIEWNEATVEKIGNKNKIIIYVCMNICMYDIGIRLSMLEYFPIPFRQAVPSNH